MVFRALSRPEITQIVDLELHKVQERIAQQEIKLQATEAAKQYLSDRGYNFEFGARPLRRVIQNEVEDVLSDGFLSGKFETGDIVQIDLVEGNLTFSPLKAPKLRRCSSHSLRTGGRNVAYSVTTPNGASVSGLMEIFISPLLVSTQLTDRLLIASE